MGMNRRYYLSAPGKLEMKEEPVPEPGPGDLLIRVRATLTCGTDLKMLQRGHPKLSLPTPFGHEASGTVVSTGKDVREFQEGDRVMFPVSAPCGTCSYCRMGRENLCDTLMEKKLWGTYADYFLVPAHVVSWQTYHIPEGITFAEAALLDPLASVLFAWQSMRVHPSGAVVVLGTGAIALLHALIARDWGFSPVIVIGRRPNRFSVYEKLGISPFLQGSDARERVKEMTDGLGGELVIDTTGVPEMWKPGMELLRGGGTYLAFAGCEEGTEARLDTTLLHYEQLTLTGSFHYDRRAVASAYSVIAGKTYPLHYLISGEYPLENVPDVMEKLNDGKGFKYVIVP